MDATLLVVAANLATTLAVVVAVVFGILQTRETQRARKESTTLSALEVFRSEEFARHRQTARFIPANLTFEESRALTHDQKISLNYLWNQFDYLGFLVDAGYIELPQVDVFVGHIVDLTWNQSKHVVEHRRAEEDNPNIAVYFERLAVGIQSLRPIGRLQRRKPTESDDSKKSVRLVVE